MATPSDVGKCSLGGRVALVTGAAAGIGWAAACRLLGEGAFVVLADRDERALDAARQALPEDAGHDVARLDVTVEADWAAVATEIAAAHGRLDILVNNAGGTRIGSLAETTLDAWREMRALNLDSLFLGTRAMLPLLAASGRGAIVNVASIRGIIAGPGSCAYSAAKGGARMFTKAAALECAALGNGVRVNTVNPGLIDTPLARAVFAAPDATRRRLADIPLGRAGRADEIADAILFLASDASAYMTGAELTVDGGQTAG